MPEEEVQTPEAAPAPAAPQQPAAKSGGDDNLMAALSYVWIISIIMLVTKKDSDFIQFHAKQGFVLFVVSVIWWIITVALFFLWFISWIIYLVIFIAAVIGFIKAYSGERYSLPVVGDIAAKINF